MMANSYLATFFIFILLQLSFFTVDVWQILGFSNGVYAYFAVLAFIILLLLYGFTHAVKANANAKSNSYIMAFLSVVFALVVIGLCIFAKSYHPLTLVLAGVSIISALRLAYVTYRKTKSYFM